MASSRTYYPKFSQALYQLDEVMGELRAKLIKHAAFGTADLAAFDALKAQVDTATLYFPEHVEAR